MASFIGKINRMRNHRLHMANEYIFPSHSMYHEIVQGIPWAGGISRDKPKRLVVQADKFLKYVVKKRPEYKNYPWCPADTGGVCIFLLLVFISSVSFYNTNTIFLRDFSNMFTQQHGPPRECSMYPFVSTFQLSSFFFIVKNSWIMHHIIHYYYQDTHRRVQG
jgi:hypothetical protein